MTRTLGQYDCLTLRVSYHIMLVLYSCCLFPWSMCGTEPMSSWDDRDKGTFGNTRHAILNASRGMRYTHV